MVDLNDPKLRGIEDKKAGRKLRDCPYAVGSKGYRKWLNGFTSVRVVRSCDSTKSEDGGSCSPRVPCDGVQWSDGELMGGCGEPCSFVMHREGE
jgi:hypothetical protein